MGSARRSYRSDLAAAMISDATVEDPHKPERSHEDRTRNGMNSKRDNTIPVGGHPGGYSSERPVWRAATRHPNWLVNGSSYGLKAASVALNFSYLHRYASA